MDERKADPCEHMEGAGAVDNCGMRVEPPESAHEDVLGDDGREDDPEYAVRPGKRILPNANPGVAQVESEVELSEHLGVVGEHIRLEELGRNQHGRDLEGGLV